MRVKPRFKSAVPTHRARGTKLRDLIRNGAVWSGALAILSALLSAWVGYRQADLQAEQTRLATEQNELNRQQAYAQALQNLPELLVRRGSSGLSSFLVICGSIRSISSSNTYWLSEFGRYTVSGNAQSEIPRIRVALVPKDGVFWRIEDRDSEERDRTYRSDPDSECRLAQEPDWGPILNFIQSHGRVGSKFGYFHRYESLIVVEQRDRAGVTYARYYLFTHDRAGDAELLSEREGRDWLKTYETARRVNRQVVLGPNADLTVIEGFFPP